MSRARNEYVWRELRRNCEGITKELLPDYLTLKGERFEYETMGSIDCLKRGIIIEELVIDTIYENDNK